MRILKLPDVVKQNIRSGELTEGQARPLLKADEETINEILPKILAENWSARKIEQLMVQLKKRQQAGEKKSLSKMPYENTIKKLSTKLKTDVNIRSSARGTGQITIKFKTEDELKRLEELLSK